MTDTELDEILDTWSAPQAPAELRSRVQAGFEAGPQRKMGRFLPTALLHIPLGKGLFAGAVLAGLAFVLMVSSASSQSSPAVPWTVDSEFLVYADDGSSSVQMRLTSYEVDGTEKLVSRSMPGDPIRTAMGRVFDASFPAMTQLHMHLLGLFAPNMAERMNQARRSRPPNVGFISGCDETCLTLQHYGFAKAMNGSGCIAGTVVDRATILNYATEAVQERWTEHGRMTLWTAPQLSCFALKVTYEDQLPDGTFRLVSAKQARKVTLNP